MAQVRPNEPSRPALLECTLKFSSYYYYYYYPDLLHHFDSEAPFISKMHIYKLHSRKVSIFEQWDHEYC